MKSLQPLTWGGADLETANYLGDSPEEAVREIGKAMRLWLEAARSMGRALPEPTDRPVAA